MNRFVAQLRCFSSIRPVSMHASKEQISLLVNSKQEDVASFVRFNRSIQWAKVENFSELYSKKSNPSKSDYELEELRLRIALICAEYDYHARLKMRVPAAISLDDMKIMLRMKSPESRELFLIKSYFRDTAKQRAKVKKAVKHELKVLNGAYSDQQLFVAGCFSTDGKIRVGGNCVYFFTHV